MFNKAYFELYKRPEWQKKRLEVLQRDGFKCLLCGSTEEQLHVHHTTYFWNLNPWEYPDEFYVSLCSLCHTAYHGSKISLLEIFGKLSWYDQIRVINMANLIYLSRFVNETGDTQVLSENFPYMIADFAADDDCVKDTAKYLGCSVESILELKKSESEDLACASLVCNEFLSLFKERR